MNDFDDERPEPGDRAERLFKQAVTLDPEAREQLLATECAGDTALETEVRSLLDHVDPDSILDHPAISVSPDHPPVVTPTIRIDAYRILERLGEGGMGIVYLAEQQSPVRRLVALKVLKHGRDSKEVVARFASERQALALMEHPGIAKVYDAGTTDDGRPYFVMELVRGTPLDRYCDDKRLTIDERLRLLLEVFRAVQHAHQKGIIHRDLKPANVLIAEREGVVTPKVIDFGVAKAMGAPLTELTLYTAMGTFIGTPEYMSPEQAQHTGGEIDTRSDIYSLGAILHTLLVGRPPHDFSPRRGLSYLEIVREIDEVEPQRPSEAFRVVDRERATSIAAARQTNPAALARRLRGDLDWITVKALEKAPSRRYPSASELAADIERHLADEPVSAGRPDPSYVLSKLVRRHRATVIAVAAVFLALAVGFAVSTGLYLENRRSMEIVAQQRDDLLRHADAARLASAEEEARALWPAYPSLIPRFEDWLHEAEELASRFEMHRDALSSLRAVETTDIFEGEGVSSQDADDDLERFAEFVRELGTFVDPDPRVGTMAGVRKRLEDARVLRRRSIDTHLDAWHAAIRSIADPVETPAYGRLLVNPQIGLVPVGRDPGSGFWEFADVQSGEIPVRDEHGVLKLTDDSAIVFVLVPGGVSRMGAELPGPGEDDDAPHVDRRAYPAESPIHDVELDPFLLAKYEVSHAQWAHVMEEDPSESPPGTDWGGIVHTRRHPVADVNWAEAAECARRLGMVLPTEAQWEYAARAGTTTPWWFGRTGTDVTRYANVCDLSAVEKGKPPSWQHQETSDGYADTAPIDAFPPNPWGFHNISGNVWEWCDDLEGAYTLPVVTGTGLRLVAKATWRMVRGGNYAVNATGVRVARRVAVTPEQRHGIGVRPARALEAWPLD